MRIFARLGNWISTTSYRNAVLLIIYLFLYRKSYDAQLLLSCPETKETVNYVQTCPHTTHELEAAVKLKNCSSFVQNCTTPDAFVYHCLPNHYLDKLVEVCAITVYIINGYCAEYNEKGGVIQENFDVDCKQFSKPCPRSYLSVNSYKYVNCYNISTEKFEQSTNTGVTELPLHNKSTTPSSTVGSGHHTYIIFGICFGVYLCILLSISLMIAIRRWLSRRRLNTDLSEDQIGMNQPMADMS